MDNVTIAKLLLSCLDLTSLRDNDSTDSISALCQSANTSNISPAALCVYSSFIPVLKEKLANNIKIATVINFPQGQNNLALLEQEINKAILLGADELDVVLPYNTLLEDNIDDCRTYLTTARNLCKQKTLKIIIESGELKTISNIKLASQLCIDAKADFIKTSTGKTSVSATFEAANAILETIKTSGSPIGFKASGGIKTFMDAKGYFVLAQSIMGNKWLNPKNFRIGASSLFNDLHKTINQGY